MQLVLALAPLLLALVMLVVFQRSSRQAGLATLACACLFTLAVPAFHLLPLQLLLALGTGFATALTILLILFPALVLYHIQQITGATTILVRGLTWLCAQEDLQILLLVLGFSPLIEALCGFGVGIVVTVPFFLAFGISPTRSALLGILGQLTTAWGAMGIALVFGANLAGVNSSTLGAYTALLLAPISVGGALLALVLSGGREAIGRYWRVACITGIIMAVSEWAFSLVPGIELTGILSSLLTMLVLILWSRCLPKTQEQQRLPAFTQEQPALPAWRAVAPYAFLTGSLLFVRLVEPVRVWLQTHYVLVIAPIQLNYQVVYNSAFWLLLAVWVSLPLLKVKRSVFQQACTKAWFHFVPGAMAILSFVIASQVMLASGMTATLGAAAATFGDSYSWFAPWLGALGGWLTGSNVGGNAMFALLQRDVAGHIGLSTAWLEGAQNSACSLARMASPACVVLAATTANLHKGEGYLLRKAGPLVLAGVVVITVLLTGVVFSAQVVVSR